MCGSCGLLPWRRAGFRGLAAGEGLDDDHRTTASGACLARVPLVGIGAPVLIGRLIRLWLGIDQTPDLLDPVAADAIGQEAGVTDTVEARWQDMDQERRMNPDVGRRMTFIRSPRLIR